MDEEAKDRVEKRLRSSIEMVSMIVSFRFDKFSELFVELWIKGFRKKPKLTIFSTILATIIIFGGLAYAINESEKIRKERLEVKDTYSEQYDVLKETENNLNNLATFIKSKKAEIEATQTLIKELESEKKQLEPIVNANKDVVNAIFAQQQKAQAESIWFERGISFALGIFASLIATLIWHFVARFKSKPAANKSIRPTA